MSEILFVVNILPYKVIMLSYFHQIHYVNQRFLHGKLNRVHIIPCKNTKISFISVHFSPVINNYLRFSLARRAFCIILQRMLGKCWNFPMEILEFQCMYLYAFERNFLYELFNFRMCSSCRF